MKVCVIGGTGQISIYIVRSLLKCGYDVTCFNLKIPRSLLRGR